MCRVKDHGLAKVLKQKLHFEYSELIVSCGQSCSFKMSNDLKLYK